MGFSRTRWALTLAKLFVRPARHVRSFSSPADGSPALGGCQGRTHAQQGKDINKTNETFSGRSRGGGDGSSVSSWLEHPREQGTAMSEYASRCISQPVAQRLPAELWWGVSAANVGFSVAGWGDRALPEAHWRLRGDHLRRDRLYDRLKYASRQRTHFGRVGRR